MKPEGPQCQSCGMPLARDSQGGGTNADGTTSVEYCSHCYSEGRFTNPSLTAAQMVARVEEKLHGMSLPPATVSALASNIPNLKRWRT